ncbi:acyltransferase family protein [Pseudonocardia sp. EV170527-09]|uniref:acyltransferase family protein n=1 Tax=Pseudonocardia sp. EV170527-09 TaxID=2603411 RepID=UPI001F01F0E1|nr:acyltransferase family protein [Pseudonocardia sp. EV170527-09]
MVVAGVAIATRRDGADLHRRLTGTLLAVGGASFAYSVYLTLVNQPLAYFHSATRIWEFALGGLLALWISRIEDRPELTPGTRAVLGWGGVVALVSCGILLQVDRAFPGWAALWPTLAAAMVLVAGRSGHRFGVDHLLSGRVLRTIGDLSFPLYLWHWPILTLTLVRTGQDRLDLEQGAAVIGVSFVLAWLTHRFVEQRVAALDVRRALRTGGVLALTVLVAAGSWYGLAAARASTPVLAGSPSHPGTGALSPQFDLASLDPADAELTPSLVQAPDDWSYHRTSWDCGPSEHGADLEVCTVPAPDPETSERTVAVVGDSHAQQYAAALAVIAEQRNWSMVGMFRGACPMSVRSETVADDQGCTDWNAAVHDQLVEMHPDAVLTLASRDVRPGLHEQTPEGFVQAWQRLDAAGIPVVAVRDNPRFDFNVVDCVATQGRGAPDCDVDRHTLYQPYPPWSVVPGVPPNVVFADVSDGICDPALCRSEVGNVLVYMDDNHLTATYAETLAPTLATAFDHLGW